VLSLPVRPTNPKLQFTQSHIQSLLEDLLSLILAGRPNISLHVQLSAVCHRWRACLARRRTLSWLYDKDRTSTDDEPYEARDRALLAVLSRCAVLESLLVENNMLTDAVLGALGGLPCARTLRSLTVSLNPWRFKPTHVLRVDRLLASLPALEVFRIKGLRYFPRFVQYGVDAITHHGVRELATGHAARSLDWMTGFTELRWLNLQLCPDLISCAHVQAGLRAVIPRLEALKLTWPRHILSDVELIELLGDASALRKLVLNSYVNIGDGFVRFASKRLTGLETLVMRTYNVAVVALLALLPRLRRAELFDIMLPNAVPLQVRESLALERLCLGLASTGCPYVEITLPALKSLTVFVDVPCMINCPALEEAKLDLINTSSMVAPSDCLPFSYLHGMLSRLFGARSHPRQACVCSNYGSVTVVSLLTGAQPSLLSSISVSAVIRPEILLRTPRSWFSSVSLA